MNILLLLLALLVIQLLLLLLLLLLNIIIIIINNDTEASAGPSARGRRRAPATPWSCRSREPAGNCMYIYIYIYICLSIIYTPIYTLRTNPAKKLPGNKSCRYRQLLKTPQKVADLGLFGLANPARKNLPISATFCCLIFIKKS